MHVLLTHTCIMHDRDASSAATSAAVMGSSAAARSADISELDLPKSVSIRFPDGNDKIMNFEVTLKPDEGLYK